MRHSRSVMSAGIVDSTTSIVCASTASDGGEEVMRGVFRRADAVASGRVPGVRPWSPAVGPASCPGPGGIRDQVAGQSDRRFWGIMWAGPSPTSGPRGYLPSASKRPWPRTWPSAYARTRPRRACGTRRAGRRAGAIAALLKGPERSRSRLTRRLASWAGPAVSPARPRQTAEVSMASISPPARSPAASLLERGRGTAVRRQPFHRSCGAGMGGIAAPRPAPRRRPRAPFISCIPPRSGRY